MACIRHLIFRSLRMAQSDPRIDAYLANAAEFARPILSRLREFVHAACPEAEETLKWGAPSFTYKGKILCGMAAFKQHAAFNLWHGALVVGDHRSRQGMGQFGRLTGLADLPGKREMTGYLRQAMRLIDDGVKAAPRTAAASRPALEVPGDLTAALAGNPAAKAAFDGFPPGQKREYVEWLIAAKRPETRQRRLLQAIEWMAEGKRRNWKYESC
jgi:uncharacterized protein YdeI (YjbR/CyaY-like superfamily)